MTPEEIKQKQKLEKKKADAKEEEDIEKDMLWSIPYPILTNI